MKVYPHLDSPVWPIRVVPVESGQSMSGPSNSKIHGALLSVADVAEALAVSERTVRRMIASGEVPIVRLGRSVRIRQIDLDALIGRQLHTGGR
jgi:excisionase family DNA binding protein